MASREESQKNFGKVIAKAWTDDEFKVRLLSDPTAVFKENGVDVPDGIEVKIVEDTDKVKHVTMPPRPIEAELTDEDLKNVAGGEQYGACCDSW